MKRVKHHKIKKEKAECSTQQRVQEEHDMAYYIHDRVELMHQVFSIIKYKELKSMAPECVRNLAIGDLEELCTEELLGISSKRLLAVLDGVEPPSDSESSSPSPPPEELETISLDSISSDEELLASNSKKRKHKHRHHRSKSKSKKKEKPKEKDCIIQTEEISELSKASRAGLTVLELLELQARARAIRAQLQKEQANKRPSETTVAESSHHSSENEVEIKEEPPDVVEISSEDEKPNLEKLKKNIAEKLTSPKVTEPVKEPEKSTQNPQTVTKHINDLVITVPQAVTTRKIRLNRNKVTVSTTNNSAPAPTQIRSVTVVAPGVNLKTVNNTTQKLVKEKPKKKKKDKNKKTVEKYGSDHDEITLQLSDTEKMDLLEDLDESRRNYDKVSSSSEDTESSSSDSDDDKLSDKILPVAELLKNVVNEKKQNNAKDNSVDALSSLQKDDNTPKEKLSEIPSSLNDNKIIVVIDNSHTSNSKSLPTNESNQSETITGVKQLQNNSNENPSKKINNKLTEESESVENRNSLGEKSDDNSENRSLENKLNDAESFRPGDKTNDVPKKHKPGNKTNDQDGDEILANETTDSSTEQTALSYKTLCVTTSSNYTHSVTVVDKSFDKEVSSSNNYSPPPPKTHGYDEIAKEITSTVTPSSNDTHCVTVLDKYFGEEVIPPNNVSLPPKTHVNDEKVLKTTSNVTHSSNDSVTVGDKSFGEGVSLPDNDSSPPKTHVSDEKAMEITSIEDIPVLGDSAIFSSEDKQSQNYSEKNNQTTKDIEPYLSDGELSDRHSSEVEAVNVQPEVVCISDEEENPKKKVQKKKKKKEKKSKKDKKSKKLKSDFRECSDQNFYKDADLVSDCKSQNIIKSPANEETTVTCDNDPIDLDSDDIYEYLELSDDSSCYEVEGTILSKEPTAEEIEALSAKIDEIEREDVVTDKEIREHEQKIAEKETNESGEDNVENISWKDRYLGSKKVKKVLSISNILNMLRKKNKELKKMIQDSKKAEEKKTSLIDEDVPKENIQLEEGSIEQYNALQGSTKYVDPVKEPADENKDSEHNKEDTETVSALSHEKDVTREMKKDAKQLLKMYRRLLKYNDMNKKRDPTKKKRQKLKKKEKQILKDNIAATTLTKIDVQKVPNILDD